MGQEGLREPWPARVSRESCGWSRGSLPQYIPILSPTHAHRFPAGLEGRPEDPHFILQSSICYTDGPQTLCPAIFEGNVTFLGSRVPGDPETQRRLSGVANDDGQWCCPLSKDPGSFIV